MFDAIIAAGQADRRRSDPGHRSRLRSARAGRAADAKPAAPWAHDDRQSDRRAAGRVSCSKRGSRPARSRREHYVVKTLVTTEMIRRIADAYGVQDVRQSASRLQVHRRHDRRSWARSSSCSAPRNRTASWSARYARDKDAAVAAMLLAELAAQVKAGRPDAAREARRAVLAIRLSRRTQISVTMPGSQGHGATWRR